MSRENNYSAKKCSLKFRRVRNGSVQFFTEYKNIVKTNQGKLPMFDKRYFSFHGHSICEQLCISPFGTRAAFLSSCGLGHVAAPQLCAFSKCLR